MPNHPYPGRLIVVEGPDGAGKSYLCSGSPADDFRGLAETLRENYGLKVLLLREPGGCELSEYLRAILTGQSVPGALTSHRAEALLFAASRAQLVEEVVRPALAQGTWVLLDRFYHSSIIYQGLARGLPVKEIKQLSVFATAGLRPDRVLALQVSEPTIAARRHRRDGAGGDRIEETVNADTLRRGYASLRTLDPHQVVEVSAEGSPQTTLELCLESLADLLPDALIAD